jgi:cobalt-precorrin-5B (C1)-methyltransferase
MKLDLTQSIKCSNYIGETLDLAVSYGMKDFLLVGNIGKLVKLAAGIMNTHSKVADGRCEIFTAYAALCGADTDRLEQIMESITTEEILVYLQEWGIRDEVMQRICHAVEKHVAHRVGGKLRFGVMIFSEKQGFLGETKDAQEVLRAFLEERK